MSQPIPVANYWAFYVSAADGQVTVEPVVCFAPAGGDPPVYCALFCRHSDGMLVNCTGRPGFLEVSWWPAWDMMLARMRELQRMEARKRGNEESKNQADQAKAAN